MKKEREELNQITKHKGLNVVISNFFYPNKKVFTDFYMQLNYKTLGMCHISYNIKVSSKRWNMSI